MNIDKAKTILLEDILQRIGAKEAWQKGNDKWYYSPFRIENEPSFHIDTQKNIWYDFGEKEGGDNIDLVRFHLLKSGESDTLPDALRWLENMFPLPLVAKITVDKFAEKNPSLVLKSMKALEHRALKKYLSSRGISIEYASKYLVELKLHNKETGNCFSALGFRNQKGGYEVRNELFKGCFRNKTFTFLRGSNPDVKFIHIYEGFMDFLSVLMQLGTSQLACDAIILNSTNCLEKALAYVNNYGYKKLYSWMDNDSTGEEASLALKEFCKTQEGLLFVPQNSVYAPHKDVNDWHMNKLNLKA
ncbi:MAG TPA: toprim domain-containing protein [Bacteroidia bacterium]|nr:toprim domain-containing protein [Bacteroidia bacterium]HRH07610.1 toprim domain-containing protein [Bacteroidia bacterium]